MITLTDANFAKEVLESDKPVLVDFWTEWCPPCRMVAPILEEIAKEYGERLTVAKLNADDFPDIANRYGVMGFPTLNLYRGGEVVRQVIGAKPKRVLLAELEGQF